MKTGGLTQFFFNDMKPDPLGKYFKFLFCHNNVIMLCICMKRGREGQFTIKNNDLNPQNACSGHLVDNYVKYG